MFRSPTVRQNLVLQASKGEDEAIEEATSAFLNPRGERFAHVAGTLSSGQQQVPAVASAYVQQARLTLLDEAIDQLVTRALGPGIWHPRVEPPVIQFRPYGACNHKAP